MSDRYGGACLCGAVGFEVTGPTLWCAHCHCTQCRRSHGAGYVTWVGTAEDRFRVVRGESALDWFESSPGARRGFCTRCGSSLFFRSERWPGEVHVVLANFDGPIDRRPQGHVHWDTRVDWALPADELPRKGGDDSAG